jgi:hypothetical protein
MYPKQNRSRSLPVVIGLALATLAATAGPVTAQQQQPQARYFGIIVNMQATTPGTATTPVNIVVNRWSTAAEQDQVMTTVLEQGGKALLGLLQKLPPVGSVAPVGGVGFNVPYATRSRGADGIERIFLLMDRPMSFAERWYAGRSTEYPFMLIELTIRPSGEGQGQIIVAARLNADKFNRTLVVENLDFQPMQITSVKRER